MGLAQSPMRGNSGRTVSYERKFRPYSESSGRSLSTISSKGLKKIENHKE